MNVTLAYIRPIQCPHSLTQHSRVQCEQDAQVRSNTEKITSLVREEYDGVCRGKTTLMIGYGDVIRLVFLSSSIMTERSER
jgi:hypothetical protein